MKKISLIIALACLSSGIAMAGSSPAALVKAPFDTHTFNSSGTQDVVTINVGGSSDTFNVEIHVDNFYIGMGPTPTGVDVKNCSATMGVTHISPDSDLICTLNAQNPVISISSDSDDKNLSASGKYQVQKS